MQRTRKISSPFFFQAEIFDLGAVGTFYLIFNEISNNSFSIYHLLNDIGRVTRASTTFMWIWKYNCATAARTNCQWDRNKFPIAFPPAKNRSLVRQVGTIRYTGRKGDPLSDLWSRMYYSVSTRSSPRPRLKITNNYIRLTKSFCTLYRHIHIL